jgi:phycobilisome core-membrane linker protein
VREFIRQLAKSNVFRSMYWTPLYVMKAVEYIHRRLLGRPTYGRQETNKYFDICAKKGFYALIDAILDTPEYSEAFGEDTVPYERYVTPQGLSLRTMRVGSSTDKAVKSEAQGTPRFIELGQVTETRTAPDIEFRILQGVTKKRDQSKVFKLTQVADKANLKTVIGAAYRQIFERDIAPYIVKNEFSVLETKLSNGDITLKEFVEGLGTSSLYTKEFYTPYPNTKVIELGTKHFLGRAPLDQAEIRKYNQILATRGIRGFIGEMVNSMEYAQAFGEDVVPYNRYLTLPAANYPNTQRLYNKLTKQDQELVVPSFEPVDTRNGFSSPVAAGTSESTYVGLGRSSGGMVESSARAHKPARIYRLTPGTFSAEVDQIINAIYSQVMEVPGTQIPESFRLVDLETQLLGGQLSVREFIRALVSSDAYKTRFDTPYPNGKTVEFLFRHLLGRTPATQLEILQYNKLLEDGGLPATVNAILNGSEYALYFGDDVVPYKRVPTLPAGNYLGSVKVDSNSVE